MKRSLRDAPRAFACAGPAWLGIAWMREEYLAHVVLGFAVLTLLPLGLALALENAEDPAPTEAPLVYRVCTTLLPGLLVGGFFLFWGPPASLPSAMATGGIALFSCNAALLGLVRFLRRPVKRSSELAIDYGLVMLVPAMVWLFASRLGRSLLGFHEPTVLLTAEHFVHAGFAAPLLFGVLGRHLGGAARLRAVHRLATLTVCAAMPLVAIGIATVHAVEVIAALVLAAGMVLGAVVIAAVGWQSRSTSKPAAAALLVSAGSLTLAMAFAAMWAVTGKGSEATAGSAMATLDQMLKWHGAVNGLGFLGAGLLGDTLLEATRKR